MGVRCKIIDVCLRLGACVLLLSCRGPKESLTEQTPVDLRGRGSGGVRVLNLAENQDLIWLEGTQTGTHFSRATPNGSWTVIKGPNLEYPKALLMLKSGRVLAGGDDGMYLADVGPSPNPMGVQWKSVEVLPSAETLAVQHIIQLRDGRVLAIGRRFLPTMKTAWATYESRDEGGTWKSIDLLHESQSTRGNRIFETRQGVLIAAGVVTIGESHLRIRRSYDGGLSWKDGLTIKNPGVSDSDIFEDPLTGDVFLGTSQQKLTTIFKWNPSSGDFDLFYQDQAQGNFSDNEIYRFAVTSRGFLGFGNRDGWVTSANGDHWYFSSLAMVLRFPTTTPVPSYFWLNEVRRPQSSYLRGIVRSLDHSIYIGGCMDTDLGCQSRIDVSHDEGQTWARFY